MDGLMSRNILVAILLLLGGTWSLAVHAEAHEGLLKDDPERLGIFVDADQTCPFVRDDVLEIVTGEMTHQNLRAKKFEAQEVYLKVIVSCAMSEAGGYVYNVMVDFVIAEPRGLVRPWQGIYGAYGLGRTGSILQVAGEATRDALRDYLDSNPGLGIKTP
jgi:hypothetical protein